MPDPCTIQGDFSNQADAYARSRPSYPEQLVGRLITIAGAGTGDPIVEIGSGTGIFTRLLSGRGFAVTAVEPNARMRSLAPLLPDVAGVDGTFEATGLPAMSQRWAVAAQAFHWADPSKTLPEIRRVLQPGGHFTVLWNNRDTERSEVLAFVRGELRHQVPDFDEGYRSREWVEVMASTGDFTAVQYAEEAHVVTMDRRRFFDLWKSHNRLSARIGPERLSRLLASIEEYFDCHHLETVPVPYICCAWTAARTD